MRGRRWSLRTRLVVSAVALIAVVASVIGAVTTIAFGSYLYGKLDDQLRGIAVRADLPGRPPPVPGDTEGPLDFLGGGGQPFGTVGALVPDGGSAGSEGARTVENTTPGYRPDDTTPLDAAQLRALGTVPADGEVHDVTLPGLGGYRVMSLPTTTDGSTGDGTVSDGAADNGSAGEGTVLVGIPAGEVEDALSTLILVEICVAATGLLAAGITGTALVGVALRPLRRVAATATRVSELPLHSGEVAPLERVPDAEADPRTEVGQVGAALNRMLDHVGSALTARQQSETRVRQFVADASHELRTPLASIRGYAELTRRGRDTVGPDTRHALGRIESEATRMTGLVEDLLLLARLDAGRPLDRERTDLPPLVVDAVSDARAAGPDHTWRLELPVEPAAVGGDAARLHQVLVNLLANARTHTPPGTTVVARVQDRGPTVVLEVEDDGPGIPPELLPYIFERFARGDASRSRTAGSTGLGLAIVDAVVSAHGGRVGVNSRPGRTVFGVELPTWNDPPGATDPLSQTGHRRITQP
ncbi:HAMP domain-containing sensor histidine kinase [Streptomyces sp. AM8-1-1]|uniref:HAMP domain-containing sensor histidine kinase n=1 Tax=Streptomyces sp. AM8-1-1 TaxID=3075825 RepID=UPI0028C3A6F8|nr:HAMP domain-containing sensor histidine kinase [Streptomyces sp. AM8-1-1]WNO73644.1 HAMP domain-containing sensor histidine kinase [Streptomyces sp. AM8-1-1]